MLFTLEADDPALRQLVLLHLVRKVERSPNWLDELLMQGVAGELVDLLRHQASLSEVVRISDLSWPAMTVQLDDTALLNCFDAIRRLRRDETLKEYLARNGASSELLAQWFSLARAEADGLRRKIGPTRSGGRPRLPDLATRDAIHQAWSSLPSGRPEREAYYDLHQAFPDLSVNVLYQVIHEHDAGAITSARTQTAPATSAWALQSSASTTLPSALFARSEAGGAPDHEESSV